MVILLIIYKFNYYRLLSYLRFIFFFTARKSRLAGFVKSDEDGARLHFCHLFPFSKPAQYEIYRFINCLIKLDSHRSALARLASPRYICSFNLAQYT